MENEIENRLLIAPEISNPVAEREFLALLLLQNLLFLIIGSHNREFLSSRDHMKHWAVNVPVRFPGDERHL